MSLTERENYLRNASMTGPEWMPCTVAISDASWDQLRGELEEVVARHPILFPDFKKGQRDYDHYDFGPAHRAKERFTDAWGCVWHTTIDGIAGVVVESPLTDWSTLESYEPPDPLVQADRGPADWEGARRRVEKEKRAGRPTLGGVPHGFLFMRFVRLWRRFAPIGGMAEERKEMKNVYENQACDFGRD